MRSCELMEKEQFLITLGGRVRCRRCQAKAKNSGLQCLLPAITAKRVCRVHGGLSQGPITPEGKERCRAAKTIHGERTQEAIERFRSKMLELQNIETLARSASVITGPKTKGRKQTG